MLLPSIVTITALFLPLIGALSERASDIVKPGGGTCPVGKPFYLFTAKSDKLYAVIGEYKLYPPEEVWYWVRFSKAAKANADKFTFVQDAQKNCQLSIVPNNLVNNTTGCRSLAIYRGSRPTTQQTVFINNGKQPGWNISEIYCNANKTMELNCLLTFKSLRLPNVFVGSGVGGFLNVQESNANSGAVSLIPAD